MTAAFRDSRNVFNGPTDWPPASRGLSCESAYYSSHDRANSDQLRWQEQGQLHGAGSLLEIGEPWASSDDSGFLFFCRFGR